MKFKYLNVAARFVMNSSLQEKFSCFGQCDSYPKMSVAEFVNQTLRATVLVAGESLNLTRVIFLEVTSSLKVLIHSSLFQISWTRQLLEHSYQILTIAETTYIDDKRFIVTSAAVNSVSDCLDYTFLSLVKGAEGAALFALAPLKRSALDAKFSLHRTASFTGRQKYCGTIFS